MRRSEAEDRMEGYNHEKEYRNRDFRADKEREVKPKGKKKRGDNVYESLLKSGVFKNPNSKNKFEAKEYRDISYNPQKARPFEFNTPALPLPYNYKPKKPISNPLSQVNYLPLKIENLEKMKNERKWQNEENLEISNKKFPSRKEDEPRPLSNPMYLRDLSSSIHSMNRDRYYKNEGSKENFQRRVDRIRDEYEFNEGKEAVGDNPYGRAAMIQHKMGGLNKADFGFNEVREQRREFGGRFDDLLASKLDGNKYNKFIISPF